MKDIDQWGNLRVLALAELSRAVTSASRNRGEKSSDGDTVMASLNAADVFRSKI